MEECELCGRKIEHAYIIEVEGVELRVCSKCAEGKHIIQEPKAAPARPSKGSAAKFHEGAKSAEDSEIIENYGSLIREARERMGLPLKVLAEMLNEKETLLLRIEEQKTLPSNELEKKLEKALNIKLSAKPQGGDEVHARGGNAGASIGEFLGK
ncbi:MAG: multiprotein bridging factor aMBF1 [Candidatus Micrarchaeaceae archaeon]